MASKILVAFVVVSFLFLNLLQAKTEVVERSTQEAVLDEIDCEAECSRRCSLSSRPNLCKRACGTCCDRCGCVPPGTSGNYDACPCYRDMTTHRGEHKCP